MFFTFTVLAFTSILIIRDICNSPFKALWITFANGIFFFGYGYITIFLLIPEFLVKKRAGWFILLFFLSGIGLSTLKFVVSDYIFYSSIAPKNIELAGYVGLRFIVVNTKDMSFIVALFCIVKYVKDYLFTEKVRRKLEKENRMSQAKLIQSQFDPHFLFNTINNLYALSLLNPDRTREVISRIRTVLKYIMDEIQKDFVPLKNEISLVENYILLEKLRYGKRLKVNLVANVKVNECRIPPMILFFLVENSFKHGSSLDAGSPWIDINISFENDKVIFKVENSKPQIFVGDEKENRKKRIRLKDLSKRLALLYGDNGFNLEIVNGENSFLVTLRLIKQFEYNGNTYQ